MAIGTLGILTRGGDCAGLNAVIRAAPDAAVARGWKVVGLRNGHLGLLDDPPDVVPLSSDAVRGDLMRSGGTILGTTTKGDPFAYPEPDGTTRDRSADVITALHGLGIDSLVWGSSAVTAACVCSTAWWHLPAFPGWVCPRPSIMTCLVRTLRLASSPQSRWSGSRWIA